MIYLVGIVITLTFLRAHQREIPIGKVVRIPMMKNNIWFKLYWTSIIVTTIFLGSDPSFPPSTRPWHTHTNAMVY
jgi:hypothetical protein